MPRKNARPAAKKRAAKAAARMQAKLLPKKSASLRCPPYYPHQIEVIAAMVTGTQRLIFRGR